MNKITLKNINKTYDDNHVLSNFSLDIEKGSMLAVTGDSGKGKSTLLNIIGLLETPDSGDVIINDEINPKPNSKKSTLIQRNIIGYLFQNYALVDNMTVDKNLNIALEYADVKDKNQAKRDVLEKVGLNDKLNNKIYQLSGGEQQRIAIARLMLKPCEIILADEPTGSLDAHNRDIVIQLLKDLNEQGKTILVVTHDPHVAEICDRVVSLGEDQTVA